MSRKMIGVSESLHKGLHDLAKEKGLPVTVMLEHMLGHMWEIDWTQVRKDYETKKPTWNNIRRIVQEYQVKYPDADDKKLSELTGYSLSQVETVTHTAHRRCIQYMINNPRCKEKRIAEECNVSEKFARRIYGHFKTGENIPKAEAYLYDDLRS